MRRALAAGAAAVCAPMLLCATAQAQEIVTDNEVSVGDAMLTPLADLNLDKDPIPPVLILAHNAPYDDTGLTECVHLLQEIGNLDAVLGEDFDTAKRTRADASTGNLAQSVIASFIPFRGVIRHFSGASRHAWEFREAITAGLARRAYLKGLGQGMGCAYPTRPVPPGLLVHPEGSAQGMPAEGASE